MTRPNRSPSQKEWPTIKNIDVVETDNAKALVERADALLKAQDDGLRAMELRMTTLFGQSVTLASAAVAATITAFAANYAPAGAPTSPTWALPWVAQSLAVLSAFWLAAVTASAVSLLGRKWTTSGMQLDDLYSEAILAAPPNSLRLAIARALHGAVEANRTRAVRYSRRLACVIGLLATGPIATAMLALSLSRPSWVLWVGAAAFCTINFALGWLAYPH